MNKQELAARIWGSANTMRSKIEANEYKDYILGFIFYKFLSDGLERYLRENDQVTSEELPEVLVEEDPETVAYLQNNVGYFIAYDHLYSTWLAKGTNFNVGDVRDALSAFSRNISPNDEELFKGIFDTLQTGLSKLGESAASQTKAIRDLLKLIKDIPMDGRQGYDVLGFIYEYLISNFAANAGKKAGEFYTPHEVSVLMSLIIASHLAGRSEIQIYDPTSGSGSLLLNIGQAVARHMGDPDRIKYFAQELKQNTYNLTRMNLVMRGIKPDNIVARNGDSLEQDWPMFDEDDPAGTYHPLYVDAVVSNPPYSQLWTPVGKESDPRYSRFGLAPDSKADYAFLLHDLYHVKPDGIMTIVLPHGVLFRGSSEAKIRKQLVEQNHIDAIIGLPANIFFGTPIATIVMVLKQRRDTDDVLFIDASQGFKKVGKNNQLRASDIRRVADAVEHRTDVDRFARVVSREEIRENDYNLNIPRYVSAAAPAEDVDLFATMFGGIPQAELDGLADYWDVFTGLRDDLFTTDDYGNARVVEGDPRQLVDTHPSVAAFQARVAGALEGMDDQLHQMLVAGRSAVSPGQAGDQITQDVFARFSTIPLVDAFEAYQVVHDQLEVITTDLEMIQTEGDGAIRQVDPRMVTKKKQKTKETYEVQEGWQGRVAPFKLVQELLLPAESAEVARLTEKVATAEGELATLLEGLTEDNKVDLAEVMNEAGDAFAKAALGKSVTAIRRSRQPVEEDSPEAIQLQAKKLLDDEAAAKKALKVASDKLDADTRSAIENLSDAQVEQLLDAKWIQPMVNQLSSMPGAVIRDLEARVDGLRSKYDTPAVDLVDQIESTERELAQMLGSLLGSDRDMAAVEALKGILGGDHE